MISYKPLRMQMAEKEINSTDLIKILKISSATMSKLNSDKIVSLTVIDRICVKLSCKVEDVIEYVGKSKK